MDYKYLHPPPYFQGHQRYPPNHPQNYTPPHGNANSIQANNSSQAALALKRRRVRSLLALWTVAALVGATIVVGVLDFDILSTDMVSCSILAVPPDASRPRDALSLVFFLYLSS